MKRTIALILILALTLVFAACGSDDADDNNTAGITGGWTRAESPVITEELAELFNRATGTMLGAEYEPVAYIASQVVAGTNHLFLVKTTAVTQDPVETYALVTIYEDLEGNVEILNITDSGEETNFNDLLGGWQQAEDMTVTDEIRSAFDKAKEGLTGADYEPVALISTQVVSGMNYCILSESTLDVIDPERSYALIYLYQDTQGNAEITDVISFEGSSGEAGAVQVANPFIEASDLSQAADIAGFDIAVPDKIDGYPEIMIEAIEKEMIQVYYYEGEFGEDGHKEVLIRKAAGTDDISGDYNEYSENSTENINGLDVDLRGEGGLIKVASWTQDGFAYAIDSSEGLDRDAIDALIELIK